MRYLSIFLVACGTSFLSPMVTVEEASSSGNCTMAVTYAEMAYKDFKKAYKSSSVDDAKKLIRTGVKKATQSSAYAIIPDCDCANAKNYALNAVTFGNKALKENDLQSVKEMTKKAMDASIDVLTAVPGCK